MADKKSGLSYSRDLQNEFEKDPKGVLERLIDEATLSETRGALRKKLEELKLTETHLPGGEVVHASPEKQVIRQDKDLLALVDKLQQGPTGKEEFKWVIGWIVSLPLKLLLGLLLFIEINFKIATHFVVIGGAIYFLVYNIKFGLGAQGLIGVLLSTAFIIAFYFAYSISYYDSDTSKYGRSMRTIISFFGSFITICFLWIFTTIVVMTPSIIFSFPKEADGENMGVFVDKEMRVTRVIFPNISYLEPNASNRTFFMKAPRFRSESVQWYSFAPRIFEINPTAFTTITVSTSFTPTVKEGDIIPDFLDEDEYYVKVEKALPGLLLSCLEGDTLDANKAQALIAEKFSNEFVAIKADSFVLRKHIEKTY